MTPLSDRVEPAAREARPPVCNRCGYAVTLMPWGCRNPCSNCGTIYPLGDCSD